MIRFQLRRTQQGNALIFVLMALVISSLGIAGYMSSKEVEMKTQAGQAEATVLDTLRNAANSAISDNVPTIQRGLPFSKVVAGVTYTINTRVLNGEIVWEPTPAQLTQMGYLPTGWNTATSSLNGAPYTIRFQRSPAGCAPIDCNIDGAVVIRDPIRDPGSNRSDGVLIGPILTKIGADSAVSLTTSPGVLTGFGPGGTWTMPNPAGNVAGVVAVRIGTSSSPFASFVRRGDLRDPNLAGNLTAGGNLAIRGTSQLDGAVTTNGTITANGAVSVNNAPLTVRNGAGACTTIEPNGVVRVQCAGSVNAATGVFSDHVEANNIQVNAGDFLIRGPGGDLMRINNVGDVTASGNVSAPQVHLNQPVAEGTPCNIGSMASLVGGGIAVCSPQGTFVSAVRYGTNKGLCTGDGTHATEPTTLEGLTCRNGHWAATVTSPSDAVFMGSYAVFHGTILDMPACRDTGSVPPTPLIYLVPANENARLIINRMAIPSGTRAVNGAGYYEGGSWTVSLLDGANTAIPGNSMVAMTYCQYIY